LLLIISGVTVLLANRDAVIERTFVFFPDRDMLATPADFGLEFKDVSLQTADGVTLHGWFVPGPGEVTWLWFHGNAGNVSHRLENLLLVHQKLGVNILLFDYRGYGRSSGRPSVEGTYRDAEAAFKYLESRPDIDPQKIVFFGRSMGCAVAVDLATRQEPYGLVLESPFTSLADMTKKAFPFLPAGFLVRGRYDSVSRIKRISVPILVLHGDRDDIVPIELGRSLYEAANGPKTFYTIAGAGHNDTYAVGGEPYFAALDGFLQSLQRE
jgi:fermentation-respiration switch protein FrsA (DUF1100 family)